MPFRVTMIWRLLTQGFTESWYYDSGGSLSNADNKTIMNMAVSRMTLEGAGVVMDAVRIQDLSAKRVVSYIQLPTTIATSGFDAEMPNAAILCSAGRLDGSAVRQMWIRGTADRYMDYQAALNQFVPNPLLVKAVSAFEKVIKNNAWRIQTAAKLFTAGTFSSPVTALASVGGAAILSVGAVGWAVGDTVIVSGFTKPLGYLNGTYGPHAFGVAALNVKLKKSITNEDAARYVTGAYVRKRVTSLVAIERVEAERPGTRRTGKIFFAQHGRRPGRR